MFDALIAVLDKAMRERGYTLSCAESCTGGLAAASITARAGVSAFFAGGVVTYSNAAKERILGVPAETLNQHGAVSEESAEAMAQGAARIFGSDCSFAITGIAGPDGGTPCKPVGTVCFAFIAPGLRLSSTRHFSGTRNAVRKQAVEYALCAAIEAARSEKQ